MQIFIFEADTVAGKTFDIALLWAIIISVFAVMLESVHDIEVEYGLLLRAIEWFFTILFTIEYFARIISIGRPIRYITSFMGIIDLLAIIPTYLSLVFVGTHTLMVIRAIRLLRIFRILKLARYISEATALIIALKSSFRKIIIFLFGVLTLAVIMGTIMYLVEGVQHGFTSIPKSIYWTIVTITTVGYGDIAPETVIGQVIASIIMITGYAIIVVPAGIFSAELIGAKIQKVTTQVCPECASEGHDKDAKFCKFCGCEL